MAESLLAVQRLSKVFRLRGGFLRRSAERITAVAEVSFSMADGETLGLVGESGCGKSTLAKLLVGLLTPTGGQVRIRGQRLAMLRGDPLRRARRSVQLIFQDPTNSLNPRMTVEEIVSEPLVIHRLVPGRSRRERVIALLQTVQLPASHLARVPRELSGGGGPRGGDGRALG